MTVSLLCDSLFMAFIILLLIAPQLPRTSNLFLIFPFPSTLRVYHIFCLVRLKKNGCRARTSENTLYCLLSFIQGEHCGQRSDHRHGQTGAARQEADPALRRRRGHAAYRRRRQEHAQ